MAARAPHAPNAALLIDFDNVTMGMRSDLSKELKTLLSSDVFRGKVTVQRAYADWRRYPQYIVPLSESSIDLIFAPAYGSSKKNATDIRMAIDGIELVFTRPEIGTFILLTGDSDFSSLVLKLKEYGKYVIGVGIQESSSDILVQNCDEYYSYTALSGLRKTDEIGVVASDPWVLVERAAEQMAKKGDVMRSDRLKQVMLEMDPGFSEKSLGYSKFSRFVTEAAKKGLIETHKLENGQVEIRSVKGGKKVEERKGPSGRDRRPDRKRTSTPPPRAISDAAASEGSASPAVADAEESSSNGSTPPAGNAERPVVTEGNPLGVAYALVRRAISEIASDQGTDTVRDSDIKRRMLALDPGFNEGSLGFPKFSRLLKQAHEHSVVEMKQGEDGSFQVALGVTDGIERPFPIAASASEASAREKTPSRGRRGERVATPATSASPASSVVEFPTSRDEVLQLLTSYSGVGQKTAETLVDAIGAEKVFDLLRNEPARVQEYLSASRATKVLEGWRADFEARSGSAPAQATPSPSEQADAIEVAVTTQGETPEASSVDASSEGKSDTKPKETKKRNWGRRPRTAPRSSGGE